MSDLNKPQLIGGIDSNGNLVPLKVASDGSIGTGGGGTGGSGDASAINQLAEIALLTSLDDKATSDPATGSNQQVIQSTLEDIFNKIDKDEIIYNATADAANLSLFFNANNLGIGTTLGLQKYTCVVINVGVFGSYTFSQGQIDVLISNNNDLYTLSPEIIRLENNKKVSSITELGTYVVSLSGSNLSLKTSSNFAGYVKVNLKPIEENLFVNYQLLTSSGTEITGTTIPTGGSGIRGLLSWIVQLISNRIPSVLISDRFKTNTVGASLTLSGTATTNNFDLIAATDISDYSWITFQLSGTWSGTVAVQFSDNNTIWNSVSFYWSADAILSSATANGLYSVPKQGKYFRLRTVSFTSGTITADAQVSNNAPSLLPIQFVAFNTAQPVTLSGTSQITGNVASAVTDSGNPVKVGGVYNSTVPTFTSGQRGDAQLTSRGELIVTEQDYLSASSNITIQDTASTTASGANGQSIISGTATANSTATITGTGDSSFAVSIAGTFTGTLQFERSLDNGSTWTIIAVFSAGTSATSSTTTTIGNFHGNASSCTNIRVRATSAITGTAQIRLVLGAGTGTITVGNGVRLYDKSTNVEGTIKPASTLPASTDTAIVVTQREVPTGAANSALQTALNTSASNIDTKLPSALVSDRLKANTVGASLDLSGSATAVNTDLIAAFDCSDYSWITFQITGTWVANVQAQFCDDNGNWIFVYFYSGSSGGLVSNTNGNGLFSIPKQGKYFRLRVVAFTSGTLVATGQASNNAPAIIPIQTVAFNGAQQVTLTSGVVDTELGTALSVIDALTPPTSPAVIGLGFGWNGATWDKSRSAGTAGAGLGRSIVAPGTAALNLLTSTSAIGAGTTINLYSTYTNITSQLIIVSGVLGSISYNIEGSMNGSIWYVLGNSTDVTNGAALFVVNKGFLYTRANLLTLTGTIPVVSIIAGATP